MLIFRILLGLIILNTVSLLILPTLSLDNLKYDKLRSKLIKSLIALISCAAIIGITYLLIPEKHMINSLFVESDAKYIEENNKIFIDRYEIVKLKDHELKNKLLKRKNKFTLELHDINAKQATKITPMLKSAKIEHLVLSRLHSNSATVIYGGISSNKTITQVSIEDCSDCLYEMQNSWPDNIKNISILNTHIDMRATKSMIFPIGIKKLEIEKCALDTNILRHIISKFPDTIAKLNLSHNRLSNSSVPLIIDWLQDNNSINSIDIAYNRINDHGLMELIKAISKIDNIKELRIKKNSLSAPSVKDIRDNTGARSDLDIII